MFKNLDFRDTYSDAESANIRYPSTAKESIGGWAYVFTQDLAYVHDLAIYHVVQVRLDGQWRPFSGTLPSRDETLPGFPPSLPPEEGDDDPNY